MQLNNLLEDFGSGLSAASPASDAAAVMDQSDFEAQRLDAFEDGYRAGWDDAVKAQSDDRKRISSDFAQNLQDLSFTYHEAYSHAVGAMTPLLEEIVNSLLPQLARDAIGLHVLEEIKARAGEIGTLEVEIAVAPANAHAVTELLETEAGFPLKIAEDDTLGEGQAEIRFGKTERRIDLQDVLQNVQTAVQGFVHDNQRERSHG